MKPKKSSREPQVIIGPVNDVLLRELCDSDIPDITEYANNEKVSINLRDAFPHPYSQKDARKFLEMVAQQEPKTIFAIEYRAHYVGNIGLMLMGDVYRKSAEIGYFIGEPFWNQGIATTAVGLICRYGFERLGLVRIHTGVFEFNPVSMRVLEKNGFNREGVFRKAVIKKGKIYDEVRFARINPNAE